MLDGADYASAFDDVRTCGSGSPSLDALCADSTTPADRADVGRAFLLLTKTSIVLGWGSVLLLCLVGEQLLILWVGVPLAIQGEMTVGQFTVFNMYL